MTEDKKIYEQPLRKFWEKEVLGLSNDIVFEFFQTKDKESIYSKGYPGGINFEFYPNKKKLNILYPFPTFKELTELGVIYYDDHIYGPSWEEIAPEIELDWLDGDDNCLDINESLHSALIEYFVSELRYREDNWEYNGEYFGKKSGIQDYMMNNFEIEYLFRKIPSNLESYLFTADDFSNGDFDGINLCNWTVQKKFNEKGYLDIEVSIDLPKFHNEVCRELCCKEHGYGIDGMFGNIAYGVYSAIDLSGTYGCSEKFEVEVEFPWNRNS